MASENFARYPAACCGELHLLIDPFRDSMLPWYDAQRMKKVEVEAEVE